MAKPNSAERRAGVRLGAPRQALLDCLIEYFCEDMFQGSTTPPIWSTIGEVFAFRNQPERQSQYNFYVFARDRQVRQ